MNAPRFPKLAIVFAALTLLTLAEIAAQTEAPSAVTPTATAATPAKPQATIPLSSGAEDILKLTKAKVAEEGKVMVENLAGKWICPMHPDIVKDNAGSCDICGMDLVTAESLGIVTAASQEPPLVIPASAALVTGKRAVVYVKIADVNVPTFEGREVVLGPRAGDFYMIKSGLNEGEMVVTKGNFKIDAAMQIQAKPSMMNPQGGQTSTGHEGHDM